MAESRCIQMTLFVLLLQFTVMEVNSSEGVVLFCSLRTNGGCKHRVTWLYDGDDDHVKISPSSCSANVMFPTPRLHHKSKYYESLKCEVTDEKSNNTLLYDACSLFSCEQTESTSEGENKTSSPNGGWWQWVLIVCGGLIALFTIIFITWKRTKGNRTQTDERIVLSSNQAATPSGPETRPAVADPEEGVSYASVSYTKKAGGAAQVQVRDDGDDDDDDDDAVTYSTVKSSSSAGASADLSNLYATVNKPNQ
ncbi:uncharacterized protein [Clinocottus analis]|uniref:uncharacterized protein n=1 Tax=Clinocottus analis TaxID=304258 RepID=UPI0035C1BE9B